jgi:hypothetical protein
MQVWAGKIARKPRRMISPNRLLKIIASTEEDISRSEMVWIFKQCYEVDHKEADSMLMTEWDKEIKRIEKDGK